MTHPNRDRLVATMRRLAKMKDDGPPIVTLYLATDWTEGRKREATRVFVKNRLRQASVVHRVGQDSHRSLVQDAERIRSWLEEMLAPAMQHRAQGLALFASSGRGLWERIDSPRPFDNQLVVRQVPHLLQLARITDAAHAALLCQVDSRSARILEFSLGGIAGQATIAHPDVPGRHHQGGWSQMRYQRHIDWQRAQHVRDAAEVLVRLADRYPEARILLSGPPEPLGKLRSVLPKRLLSRQPADVGLGQAADVPQVARRVMEWLDEEDREAQRRLVREVLEESLAGGLAAAGTEESVVAARQGAISRLLVRSDLELSGWRCTASCVFGAGSPPAECPSCGRACSACDLAARLAESVLASGGEVEVITADSALDDVGGVAARLRFLVT
ncbi:MAG: hypothetical protein JSV80_05490 [Acidobacteriota bacterium]|nr:MAG: hypothetical protein JSV80_05490 [Acidobacteriota bacterium]